MNWSRDSCFGSEVLASISFKFVSSPSSISLPHQDALRLTELEP